MLSCRVDVSRQSGLFSTEKRTYDRNRASFRIVGNPEVIVGPDVRTAHYQELSLLEGAPHTRIGDHLLVKQARGLLL
jgi:hypothetical protein